VEGWVRIIMVEGGRGRRRNVPMSLLGLKTTENVVGCPGCKGHSDATNLETPFVEIGKGGRGDESVC